MKELVKTLAIIQTELKAKKSSYNPFGKFYFRKSEDILEAVKPFLLKYKVYVIVSENYIHGNDNCPPMIESTATISDGVDIISASALVGIDLNQKGMQTAQQFGAASTYGKKYALGNLFLIDDTEDADATNDHGNGVVSKLKEKTKPTITKDQIELARKFVKSGGLVTAIEHKYKLNKGQKEELKKLENGRKTKTESTKEIK